MAPRRRLMEEAVQEATTRKAKAKPKARAVTSATSPASPGPQTSEDWARYAGEIAAQVRARPLAKVADPDRAAESWYQLGDIVAGWFRR